jgi:H+/Cl- antiporter ClcA
MCSWRIFTKRLHRRFAGEDSSFWIMTLTMAAGVSLVAVMVGMLGSIVIEGILLNSGHLSYRMNRLPFRRYWPMLFFCGFVIFALVALMRFRPNSQSEQANKAVAGAD